MVIDLFGLEADDVRMRFPEVYQHVKMEVKEKIAKDAKGKIDYVGRDWNNRVSYKQNWWVFGEPRGELRPALEDLPHYIATVETTKHRVFQFLDHAILPDNMIVAIGAEDAFILGVVSAQIHTVWAPRVGGWLGLGNDPRYSKSRCFDPFPFPAADDPQKQRIRAIAENLDAHRKRVVADHPHLTLTGLYNVLEKLRTGTSPDALNPADRRTFDDGLILILKEYHDELDIAVADAYGWPPNLSDNDILVRLVALNQERVREEAAGQIRWLRPGYQIPRFGSTKDKLTLVGGTMNREAAAETNAAKPTFPTSELEQTAAVLSVLVTAAEPLSPTALAVRFKQGRRVLPQVEAVLAALLRIGGLVYSQDGGTSYSPRRAA